MLIMRGVIAAKVLYELSRLHYLDRVYANGGLVQHQDIGLVENSLRDTDSLPEPLRELTDMRRLVLLQAAYPDNVVYPRADLGTGHPSDLSHEREVVLDAHVFVQRYCLRHVPDVSPSLHRLLDHVVTRHRDCPAGGGEKAGNYLHRGSLTGAVGP